MAVSGWWTSATVKSAMKQQLTSELQTILSADVTALEIWINTQRRIAIAVAGDPTVVALSESLQGRLDVSPGLDPVGLEEMEALRDYLETRLSPLGYSSVVVDESGERTDFPSLGKYRCGLGVNYSARAGIHPYSFRCSPRSHGRNVRL